MPKDYEVVKADHKEDWEGNYGPMKTYSLELQEAGDGTGNTFAVEMNQKPQTAPPQPGETLYLEITPNKNPDFPPRAKKVQKDGGSFGGGSKNGGDYYKPRDPAEIAGMRHAHNLLVAAHSFTPLGPTEAKNSVDVQTRIDDLEAFACVLDEKTAAISDAVKAETKPAPKGGGDSVPF